MGVVNPLTREQAAPEVQEVFDKIAERTGKVPNLFAAMAHRPDVLKAFLPLYNDDHQSGHGRGKVQGTGIPSRVDGQRLRILHAGAFRVIQTRRSHRRTNCRAPVLQAQPAV